MDINRSWLPMLSNLLLRAPSGFFWKVYDVSFGAIHSIFLKMPTFVIRLAWMEAFAVGTAAAVVVAIMVPIVVVVVVVVVSITVATIGLIC